MNTPSHVAASLLVFRKQADAVGVSALVTGAVLPDLPMFGFYGYQKLIGSSEREIWETLYFQSNWQSLFDAFNSIPATALVAVACCFRRWRWGLLCAASALLHMLCDLPLHHDDAHRHFFPLSDWRFSSPISYWDPAHFGIYIAVFELLFAVIACSYLLRFGGSTAMRTAAAVTLSLYALGITFALVVWIF